MKLKFKKVKMPTDEIKVASARSGRTNLWISIGAKRNIMSEMVIIL